MCIITNVPSPRCQLWMECGSQWLTLEQVCIRDNISPKQTNHIILYFKWMIKLFFSASAANIVLHSENVLCPTCGDCVYNCPLGRESLRKHLVCHFFLANFHCSPSVLMVDELLSAYPHQLSFSEAGMRIMITSHFSPRTRLTMASRMLINEVYIHWAIAYVLHMATFSEITNYIHLPTWVALNYFVYYL